MINVELKKQQIIEAVGNLQELLLAINSNSEVSSAAIVIESHESNEFVSELDDFCFNSNDIDYFVNQIEEKFNIKFKQ